jgi:hypothetical protein
MKYVAPYGVSDPEAPYINGDPSRGIQGSIPPANAFEHPMRELVNVIDYSELVPDATDLRQLTKSVRSQALNFVEDSGAANSLSVAVDPPLTEYTEGLPLRVRVKNTCTGPSTIDAGAGRVNIRRPNGSAMEAGDLTASGLAELVYDGTAFQMINFLGRGGTGGANNYYSTNLPYVVDTSTTANIVIAPFSPAITTVKAGDAILVKIKNSNTSATKITINAMAPIDIFAVGGGSLLPQDILANGVFLFVYDGSAFYVIPNNTIDISATLNVPTTQFPTPKSVFVAIRRKLIGPDAVLTIQLATGVYDPFEIDHINSQKIVVKGTMVGAAPNWTSFAQSGPSAAQRSTDGAANLAGLRGRYGSEVRIPVGSPNPTHGIYVTQGTFPTVMDLLITSMEYQRNNGIGDNQCLIYNVCVWGCYVGFISNATGNIICNSCFADACYYGFDSLAGGTIGAVYSGAFGGVIGVAAEAAGYFQAYGHYSRCNGSFNYMCTAGSYLALTSSDGVLGGVIDLYCANQSFMMVEVNYNTMSPPLFVEGNYNSMIVPASH